ncbi:MAG: mycothione reductase [Candidatus Tectomicrobia bacterium]|uniref:Mycothione reductase n=1 Tax=Tectimicrobiota bacterium TaxID=2528274 RepID=A0A938B137_UNCTE|nr:mycothione reductase [Candidatus Tectomicrobia bacterium]
MQQFDLIIVGAGSGNMIPGPHHAGWKIAIIEKDAFGGTCLNRGCIPSKMLIHAADVAETIHTAAPFGITARIAQIDWERIVSRVWQRIDPIATAGAQWRQAQPDTTVFTGEARFLDTHLLEVNGQRLTAPKIVLAAGSRPAIPTIPGLDQVAYHTSDTIMRLPRQPQRLAILGGGYIGAELGHFFSALGTAVTVIHRGDRLLPREDEEISQRFTASYARHCRVLLQAQAQRVQPATGGITLDLTVAGTPQQIACDALLVATGRTPNTDLLDVARAGIAVNAQGRIVTNAHYETNIPGIWALGDITNPHQLKHAANADARIVAYNIAHPDSPQRGNDSAMPHAVFSSPQVASVGLSEREVQATGWPYRVGKRAYSDTAYGWAIDDTESFVKILAHADTHQVLGAHILGPHAAILLQPLVNAMRFGETVAQLAHETMYIHPALTEVVEQALLEMVPTAS